VNWKFRRQTLAQSPGGFKENCRENACDNFSVRQVLAGNFKSDGAFMEIKIECACGQPFEFDVEPENGQMPCEIKCPACDADATPLANAYIAQALSAEPISTPIAPAARSRHLNRRPGCASIVRTRHPLRLRRPFLRSPRQTVHLCLRRRFRKNQKVMAMALSKALPVP
jgi:hypothetical protein